MQQSSILVLSRVYASTHTRCLLNTRNCLVAFTQQTSVVIISRVHASTHTRCLLDTNVIPGGGSTHCNSLLRMLLHTHVNVPPGGLCRACNPCWARDSHSLLVLLPSTQPLLGFSTVTRYLPTMPPLLGWWGVLRLQLPCWAHARLPQIPGWVAKFATRC